MRGLDYRAVISWAWALILYFDAKVCGRGVVRHVVPELHDAPRAELPTSPSYSRNILVHVVWLYSEYKLRISQVDS